MANDVKVKKGYLYTETHEWVKVEGKFALVGITDYAQKELGDIVYIELPEETDEITSGEALGNIEAVKAVEDINCPISGKIVEVNEELEDNPELINESPYEKGWIAKIEILEDGSVEELLDLSDYEEIVQG